MARLLEDPRGGVLLRPPTPRPPALTRRRVMVSAAAAGLLGACTVPPAASGSAKARTVREVEKLIERQGTSDGAGVKLARILGTRRLPMLDPFLLLDEFKSDDPADYERGFPPHPHRGFETVTIMLEGRMKHKDSVGNEGIISGGGVQWMTAGRGIVHSEMPKAPADRPQMWGYQLWVNLPAKLKMTAPRYQDLAGSDVPSTQVADGRVRVLAGQVGAVRGPVDGVAVQPTLLDVALEPGARFQQAVEGGHNALLYVLQGALKVGHGQKRVPEGQAAVLGPGDRVELRAGSIPGRALLFAGSPIGEPVARRGPFVMNTQRELQQAYEDYRAGRLTEG